MLEKQQMQSQTTYKPTPTIQIWFMVNLDQRSGNRAQGYPSVLDLIANIPLYIVGIVFIFDQCILKLSKMYSWSNLASTYCRFSGAPDGLECWFRSRSTVCVSFYRMSFSQNSLWVSVSGGTLVLWYASKIAEMNDSDPYLFKTSKILKIGWI